MKPRQKRGFFFLFNYLKSNIFVVMFYNTALFDKQNLSNWVVA